MSFRFVLVAFVLTLFLTSACMNSDYLSESNTPTIYSTLSPSRTPRPTSTPISTPFPIEELARCAEKFKAQDYQGAIDCYRPIYEGDKNNPELGSAADALAESYVKLAEALVQGSDGDLAQLEQALTRLQEGAAVFNHGEQHQRLTQVKSQVQELINVFGAVSDLRRLRETGATLDDRQTQANATRPLVDKVVNTAPFGLENLERLNTELILVKASAAEAAGDKPTALVFCKQARNLWPDGAAEAQGAAICADRLAAQLAPTATPLPPPTPIPPVVQPVMRVLPDVRGDDVAWAEQYLRELGFTNITRTVDANGGDLCKGLVTYSSPAKGSLIPLDTLIRLFYTGFDGSGC